MHTLDQTRRSFGQIPLEVNYAQIVIQNNVGQTTYHAHCHHKCNNDT